jgi:Restriction endonuclease
LLDFTELSKPPKGERLEALTREIGKRLGLDPVWTGRGPDGGRDLLFSEVQKGAIGLNHVRWLVSCKDFASSGASVSERDVGSILDKVRQHRATGFLLVTTTVPSSGLKSLLDGLDIRNGGEIFTKTWDAHELTMILMHEDFSDVCRLYFPESYGRLSSEGDADRALSALTNLLPGSVAAEIASLAAPHLRRLTTLQGTKIWPFDQESAATIDAALSALLRDQDVDKAAQTLTSSFIEFDAFMRMIDHLKSKFPEETRSLLVTLVHSAPDDGMRFNAFEKIRDEFEFGPGEEVDLATHLAPDDLEMLYTDEIGPTIEHAVFSSGFQFIRERHGDSDMAEERISIPEINNPEFSAAQEGRRINFRGEFKYQVKKGAR